MHKNLIILDSELLILLNKFKLLIILLSLINMLICDDSDSDSDSNYINNNSILDADSVIR